jgi:hypothetical protein
LKNFGLPSLTCWKLYLNIGISKKNFSAIHTAISFFWLMGFVEVRIVSLFHRTLRNRAGGREVDDFAKEYLTREAASESRTAGCPRNIQYPLGDYPEE